MNNFWQELKRRNVIKASIAYLVVNWVLLQLLAILLPIIEAPDWVMKTLTLLMALGFPIWVIISWVYEVTPEGLKKTTKVPEDQSITAKTNKRLNIVIIIGLIAAIAVSFFNRSTPNITSSNTSDLLTEKSIAVLPFENLSTDTDNEWFCDGVTEDILTNLSKIKGLDKVISRTSTKKFKGSNKTIPEIAKELGVSYIVEGSVRRHNDKVLITAQLISANDKHLWADNYNENLENIFKIQQDVSKKIVNQLQIIISPEEEKLINTAPTDNFKAYKYYLKAKSFAEKQTKEGFKVSIDLFQKAIDLDPNFADAYAEMALSYLYGGDFGTNKWKLTMDNAKQLVDKAIKINPNSSKAYSAKGSVDAHDYRDNKAKDNYEKALELNSNDAIAHREIAILYSYYGDFHDFNKSLYHINKATELDPVSPMINGLKIDFLLNNGKLIEAEKVYKNKNSLFSDQVKMELLNSFIVNKARIISIEKKDWTEAIKYYHQEIQKDPKNAFIHRSLGNAYDNILNDKNNLLKYSKKAYELDSTNRLNIYLYGYALLVCEKFKEAELLMNNRNYDSIINNDQKLIYLIRYHYEKEDYDKALQILNDSISKKSLYYMKKDGHLYFVHKSYILAQKGHNKGVRKIFNRSELYNLNKALVFAILQERDSMYYYIDKEKDIDQAIRFNGSNKVDPYRKEERYKAYLKKNYLPITHWNE